MSVRERTQSQRHSCSGMAERVYDPHPVAVEPQIPWAEVKEGALKEMVRDIAGFADKIATQRGIGVYEEVVVKD